MIYFIQRSTDQLIKVGRSCDLKRRLRALTREHGEGLEVLGIVDEARYQESGLHRLFGPLWSEREWFRPGDELLDFIGANAREWQPSDDTVAVRLPSPLVEQAGRLASIERTTVPGVLAAALAPALAAREAEALARRAAAVGLE